MAVTRILTDGIANTAISRIDGDLTLVGAAANVLWDKSVDDLIFADGAKAVFGTGNDLQIYHDGSQSYIRDTATGSLRLTANEVLINNANDDEAIAKFIEGGAVELYHNNNLRLSTTTGGVQIDGTTTDDFLVIKTTEAGAGTAPDVVFYRMSSSPADNDYLGKIEFRGRNDNSQDVQYGYIAAQAVDVSDSTEDGRLLINSKINGADHTHITLDADGALFISPITIGVDDTGHDVKFFGATSGRYMLWDESADSLVFTDNAKAVFGASDDLQISHNGSYSLIKDNGTGNLILACQDFSLTNPAVGENMITAAVDGAVTLYHDNNVRLHTFSGGVGITTTGNLGDLGTGLHIKYNDTGASVSAGYDNLIIEQNDNNGMTILSGTTTVGAIAFGDSGDNDIGLITYGHNGDYMSFTTNAGERLRINSTGDVGIGTSTPPEKLTVIGDIKVNRNAYIGSTPADGTAFAIGSSGGSQIQFYESGGDDGIKFFTHDAGTRHVEVARMDQFGNFRVGCAGTSVTEGGAMSITLNGMSIASPDGIALQYYMIKSSDVEAHIGFKSGTDTNWYLGTAHGISGIGSAGVYQTNTGAGWTNVSDENYKKALQPITNALDKIKDCRGMTGLYKTDPDDRDRRSFLIAQDWVPILPEAVDQNTTDDDDVTPKLGLQYDATIPLLVEAIKELRTQNIAYAARIAALEG